MNESGKKGKGLSFEEKRKLMVRIKSSSFMF